MVLHELVLRTLFSEIRLSSWSALAEKEELWMWLVVTYGPRDGLRDCHLIC